jgi:hypothetical protein
MGWDVTSPDIYDRLIATSDQDISWNAELWVASGAEVRGLNANGGDLILPNGDADPWLALVIAQMPRGRAIDIYEHHTSTGSPAGSDAVHIFAGIMDEANIDGMKIAIRLIEGLLNKRFPVAVVNSTDFPYLLTGGDRLYWGPDVVLIE